MTRKITRTLARLRLGHPGALTLGNLDAQRDWGYAGDYVDAMWRMLQQDEPDDYVVATGVLHSVRELVEHAARTLDFSIVWEGEGLDEVGRDEATGAVLVRIDPRFHRPVPEGAVWGDATKARERLGWQPTVDFAALVRRMALADRHEAAWPRSG